MKFRVHMSPPLKKERYLVLGRVIVICMRAYVSVCVCACVRECIRAYVYYHNNNKQMTMNDI